MVLIHYNLGLFLKKYFKVSSLGLNFLDKCYVLNFIDLSIIIVIIAFLSCFFYKKLIEVKLKKVNDFILKIIEDEDFKVRLEENEKNKDIMKLYISLNALLDLVEGTLDEVDEREKNYIKVTKELKELDKVKTDFLSTVSHELRTPLTSILGFSKIIKKKISKTINPFLDKLETVNLYTDQEINRVKSTANNIYDNIDIIISESERLTSIINNLLDITKMEAGAIEWKIEEFTVSEVINKAILSVYSLVENKDIEIKDNISPDVPNIFADKDKIMQVIVNLLSNAIKFTEEGTITCEAKSNENEVIISVKDTGIGIESSNFDLIFERFKQVGDTLVGKPAGTGLGLSICKTIVEQHRGRIWVESELGKGSKFSFAIPANKK